MAAGGPADPLVCTSSRSGNVNHLRGKRCHWMGGIPGPATGGGVPRDHRDASDARGRTMIDRTQLEALYDCDVIDNKGERIGSVKQLWLDDEDGQPTWAQVHTGLFGLRESFVPIQQARVSAGAITVPVDKELVKEAPKIDVDGDKMSDAQQEELYRYYGMIPSAKTGEHDRLSHETRGTRDSGMRDSGTNDSRTRSGREGDGMSVTRSEEHLEVGKRQVEAG